MRTVNKEEQALIDSLKQEGVLEKLDPGKMTSGVFFICGDCDRSRDKVTHYFSKLEGGGETNPRLHLVALNGGPLNLAYPHYEDEKKLAAVRSFILENQICASLPLKGLKRVILVGHWPCGQGEAWGMSLIDALRTLAEAVAMVKQKLGPEAEVVSHMHFDKGTGGMKTYHLRHRQLISPREISLAQAR